MRKKNSPIKIGIDTLLYTLILSWATYHSVLELISDF